MRHFRVLSLVAVLCAVAVVPSACPAQAPVPRDELLRCVPKSFGICLVVQDLRGHAAQWEKSRWLKAFKESALGRAVFDAPELKNVLKAQDDLKSFLDVDWPTLRDDVLGDAVVFVYEPPPAGKPQDEQGIVLVHARRPEVLARLIDNLNRAQKASGELQSLETRDYQGSPYVRRLGPKEAHYYMLSGPFFAYTPQEELLKRVIEQKQRNTRAVPDLGQTLKKAGADSAVASLVLNPRSFDAELRDKAAAALGAQALPLNFLLTYWKALDAVVVSCTVQEKIEIKLTLLARADDLPAGARAAFVEPARPSDLWQRFPDNAILGMAGKIDGRDVADAFTELAPPEARQSLLKNLQPLAALAGLDLARDIAPNVGPDWGFCILPAADPNKMPQAIAALAVRPGAKDIAVDQALLRGVNLVTGIALFDYNRRHQDDPIRFNTLRQQNVEINYLTNDKVLPPGFQPAWALKDGYLLLTTTPEAVARFRAAAAATVGAEAPLLRISSTELAKLLRA
ncbi:MAG TPA: hypothetical protein VGX76_17830, partial [Pirellulales bacterium]|nr:hypothetical protein [Pirellulales bacterium]